MAQVAEVGTPTVNLGDISRASGSFDGTHTTASGITDHALFVTAVTSNEETGDIAVSFDGTAMTLVQTNNTSFVKSYIFRVTGKGGVSSGSVAITWTGFTLVHWRTFEAENVDQTTPESDTDGSTGSSTDPSIAMTNGANDLGLSCFCQTVTGPTITTNDTEEYDDGAGGRHMWIGSDTGANMTLDCTTSSNNNWSFSCITIAESAGGGGGDEPAFYRIRRSPLVLM